MEKTITKPRIREKAEMDFPHQGKMLTAMHPFYESINPRTLQNLIRKGGCVEPTASELTSFVHEYFNGDEPQAQEVNQIMKEEYFRGFTGILYLPRKQIAHFIDYPELDEKGVVDKENLLKRLDESYAQVPFKDLKEGYVDWEKVAKHPYLVAWGGGKEGAEKLAELTSKHPDKEAYIRVPDVSNLRVPIAGVVALNSNLLVSKLCVYSSIHDSICHAFGVLK